MVMLYILILLQFVLFSISAPAQEMIYVKGKDSLDIANRYYTQDTNALFFPNKFLMDTINPEGDGTVNGTNFFERRKNGALFLNSWYSKQLNALKEPKFLKDDYENESYRFTWLRTFHNPISIRIENIEGSILLFIKRANGSGGYEPGNLIVNETITLNENDWDAFKNKVDSLNFWGISPIEKTDIVTTDGSVWIFEGKNDSLYHMIHRQNGKNKETGELCRYLLKLSNLKIKKKEFY